MSTLLGIDLGSYLCKVAIVSPNVGDGSDTSQIVSVLSPDIPSLVTLSGNKVTVGSSVVGMPGYDSNGIEAHSPVVELIGELKTDHNALNSGTNQPILKTELMAHLLRNIYSLISRLSFGGITQSVISIPAWYTDMHRAAVVDACCLSGLDPVGLVNNLEAAALAYSATHPERVIDDVAHSIVIVDIGHFGCSAAAVRFLNGNIVTWETAYNLDFGGSDIDVALAVHFALEIQTRYHVDVLADVKMSTALYKESRRVKEILAVEPTADFSCGNFLGDKSDSISVTLLKLRELVPHLGDIAQTVIEKVLNKASCIAGDIHSVQLCGGTTEFSIVKESIATMLPGVEFIDSQRDFVARGALHGCSQLSKLPEMKYSFLRDIGRLRDDGWHEHPYNFLNYDKLKLNESDNISASHIYSFIAENPAQGSSNDENLMNRVDELTKDILLYKQGAESRDDADADKPDWLNNWGAILLERFKQLGDISDLNEAISVQKRAVILSTDNHSDNLTMYLNNLGTYLQYCFVHTGKVENLNEGIGYQEKSLALMKDTDPEKARYLCNFGGSLERKYQISKDITDLNKAITNQRTAVEIASGDSQAKASFACSLGTSLYTRFSQLGNLQDLKESIDNFEKAAELVVNHPDRVIYLGNLGNTLQILYSHQGDISDLNKAIQYQREVVQLTSNNHMMFPSYTSNLASSLHICFTIQGDFHDLEEAIKYQEHAIKLTPDSHPNKFMYLSNLGNSLKTQFEWTKNAKDLDRAIVSQQSAVELLADGHLSKPVNMNNLGLSLYLRYEKFGNVVDLDQAIHYLKASVELLQDGHPNKATFMSNFGVALFSKFKQTDNIEDLNYTIQIREAANELTSDIHPAKVMMLNNLAITWRTLFESFGKLESLNNAIKFQQASLLLTPDSHIDKPGRLSNLGVTLHERFNHLHDMQDLNNAIESHNAAVTLIIDNHPESANCFSNFASALRTKFVETKNVDDLSKAILYSQKAVDATSKDHMELSLRFNNLGVLKATLFSHVNDVTYLNEAISCQELAVQLTPDLHQRKGQHLNNLGNSFYMRYNILHDIDDLNKSLNYLEQSVAITSSNDFNLPRHMYNFGATLWLRFHQLHDKNDLYKAISIFKKSGKICHSPTLCFITALVWADCTYHVSDPSIEQAYTLALDTLPQLAWRGLNIQSQFNQLKRAATVACDAAAIAIDFGKLELAVEWLEQGRSIVWNQILQLRSPFNKLQEVNPDLASKIARVARDLELAEFQGYTQDNTMHTPGIYSTDELFPRQHKLADEWNSLMKEVQSVEGFTDILQQKKYSHLQKACYGGHIVIINISIRKSDAIIIKESGPPIHVHLPEFSHSQAQMLHDMLQNILFPHSRSQTSVAERYGGTVRPKALTTDNKFQNILKELWEKVVKPVINCLELLNERNPVRPHVWWCPTGPMTFLPIHAAGIYSANPSIPSITVSDFVISSYTPNLTALITASQKKVNLTPHRKILAVIQPNTPKQASLPATLDELKVLQKHAPQSILTTLNRSEGTVQNVMSGMQENSWVHLACHGQQNIISPTDSGLHLEDGTLSLLDIVRHPLPKAEFAFLSACQTASGDEKQPDEAIHLAAGMLLAGFTGVVATMWSILDNDAPAVADDVYSYIIEDGKLDSSKAAIALDFAVRNMRKKYKDTSFSSWVPYIHIGL